MFDAMRDLRVGLLVLGGAVSLLGCTAAPLGSVIPCER